MNTKFPTKTTENNKNILYNTKFKDGYNAIIAYNDVIKFIETMPKESTALITTSPPYNIGKPYEKRKELQEYLKWQSKVIEKCKDILRPDGSIGWEVGKYDASIEIS